MILELKDKVNTLAVSAGRSVPAAPSGWRDQVRAGLEGLGWSTRDADKACDAVAALAEESPDVPVSTLMRAALRSLAR